MTLRAKTEIGRKTTEFDHRWENRETSKVIAFEPEDLPEQQEIRNAYPVPKNVTELEAVLTAYLGDAAFARRFAGCIDLIRRKNADYSQGEQRGDRIAAFRRIARDINITMEQAWAVFTQKHWGAVMKFVKDGIVESESIHGRIDDLINYFVLLGEIIEDRQRAGK